MKYRKMWIAGLALVVVIVVARWLVFPMKPFSIVPALPATPRNDTVVAVPAPPTTYSPEGTQKIEQEEKKRSIFRAIESANMPISFWGQVVDQGGDPVPGVSIRYSYSVERGNTLGAEYARDRERCRCSRHSIPPPYRWQHGSIRLGKQTTPHPGRRNQLYRRYRGINCAGQGVDQVSLECCGYPRRYRQTGGKCGGRVGCRLRDRRDGSCEAA